MTDIYIFRANMKYSLFRTNGKGLTTKLGFCRWREKQSWCFIVCNFLVIFFLYRSRNFFSRTFLGELRKQNILLIFRNINFFNVTTLIKHSVDCVFILEKIIYIFNVLHFDSSQLCLKYDTFSTAFECNIC